MACGRGAEVGRRTRLRTLYGLRLALRCHLAGPEPQAYLTASWPLHLSSLNVFSIVALAERYCRAHILPCIRYRAVAPRRWPTTARTVLAIKNGSMPISSKRGKQVAALFVCKRRENQVSGQVPLVPPSSAVSPSRISPTIIMLGSWRSKRSQAVRKRHTGNRVHLGLVDALGCGTLLGLPR
jgi:hypothetical protein